MLLLQAQQVETQQRNQVQQLTAVARGEVLDLYRHQQRVDVKVVTLHPFQLGKTADGWTAIVILDI